MRKFLVNRSYSLVGWLDENRAIFENRTTGERLVFHVREGLAEPYAA